MYDSREDFADPGHVRIRIGGRERRSRDPGQVAHEVAHDADGHQRQTTGSAAFVDGRVVVIGSLYSPSQKRPVDISPYHRETVFERAFDLADVGES